MTDGETFGGQLHAQAETNVAMETAVTCQNEPRPCRCG